MLVLKWIYKKKFGYCVIEVSETVSKMFSIWLKRPVDLHDQAFRKWKKNTLSWQSTAVPSSPYYLSKYVKLKFILFYLKLCWFYRLLFNLFMHLEDDMIFHNIWIHKWNPRKIFQFTGSYAELSQSKLRFISLF